MIKKMPELEAYQMPIVGGGVHWVVFVWELSVWEVICVLSEICCCQPLAAGWVPDSAREISLTALRFSIFSSS